MHLRRFLFILFACSIGPPAIAQTFGPFVISSSTSPCAAVDVGTQNSTVGITVSGTFSMTLQPSAAVAGQSAANVQVTPSTSTTAQNTITATGLYKAEVAGYQYFQVCVSSYVSGTATIYLRLSNGVNAALFGGGGGGSSIPLGTASQVPVMNAGASAYAPVTFSQDATITSAGVVSVTKTNNVAFGGLATLTTVAYSALVSGTTNAIWTTPTGNGQCLMSGAASFATTQPTFQPCPGGSVTIGASDVTAQATSQGSTTIATAPGAGNYNLRYYADVNTACTTGSNSVTFTANWTDATLARSLTTGSLTFASSTAASYLSGEIPIRVASGNVTYTSTVTGACGSGSSSYDVHMVLTQ